MFMLWSKAGDQKHKEKSGGKASYESSESDYYADAIIKC